MKDRIPANPGRIRLTPVPNQQNTFDLRLVDGATEPGTPLNKATLLSDDAAAAVWRGDAPADPLPSQALERLASLIWRPVAAYRTAGTHTFVVPDIFGGDAYLLGVLLMGGGGSGAASTGAYSINAGASGVLEQRVLRVGTDVNIGDTVTVTVGAGGAAVTASGTDDGESGAAGGSSSFGALITAAGGEGGNISYNSTPSLPVGGQSPGAADGTAPFGGVYAIIAGNSNSGHYPLSPCAINRFDSTDMHVYCGAGGDVRQSTVERAGGHAGAGAYQSTPAGTATAPGDGGGACYNTGGTAKSGAGAPGLCLIYARKE